MKLTLGFSPCPNDTFIFDALVNNKIDIGEFEFNVVLQDVQTLNEWALRGKLDITKISYGVLPLVISNYVVLNAGGALGKGVGPLLIARREINKSEIPSCKVFIPGKNTTAHLLFSMAFPTASKKVFVKFDQIEQMLLNPLLGVEHGIKEAGVIIHENRFTYQQKGLVKIMDLGEYWERQTNAPIPLGAIIMRRQFDSLVMQQVDALIRKSVEYAFSNYPLIADYVKHYSQEMEESVMRKHIDLYVNNYSVELKEDGKAAVNKLLELYAHVHQINIDEVNHYSVFAESKVI